MSIAFFAPDRDNAQTFRKVLSAVPDNVQVVEALLSEAIPVARRLEEQGGRGVRRTWRNGNAVKKKRHQVSGRRDPLDEL